MADSTSTSTDSNPPTTQTADRGGDKNFAAAQTYKEATNRMGTMLSDLSRMIQNSQSGGKEDLSSMLRAVTTTQSELGKLQGGVNSFSTSNLTKQFDTFGSSISSSFSQVPKAFGGIMDFIGKQAGGLKDILGSAGIVGAAAFQQAVVEGFGDKTGYKLAQESLMSVQKAALQMGVAFSGSLEDAHGDFDTFNQSLRESIVTTRSFPREILAVRSALSDAFGPVTVHDMLEIPKAAAQIHSSLNLTNVALLASKATGIDASRFTNLLSQSYTELNTDAKGAAIGVGAIAEAAKTSGIGFDETMKSIQSSTTSLKLWGGTISSVTPLFNMFSRSLGEGQRGFAPELLQSFTNGLARLSTAQKALIGLQGGMGGRGGAIGASLEMEKAFEDKTPAGMQKIVDSLNKTLTSFTGGKIITRNEAAADPALQANFLAQRQLLGQLLGQDSAAANNKTLEALSGIQQTGLQPNSDTAQGLANLLGQGEQIANETTTSKDKSDQLLEGAINSSADRIIREVEIVADRLGVLGALRGGEQALEKGVKTGEFNPADSMRIVQSNLQNNFQNAMGEQKQIRDAIKSYSGSGQKIPNELIQALNTSKANIEQIRGAGKSVELRQVGNKLVERKQEEKKTFAPKAEMSPEMKSWLDGLGEKIQTGKASPGDIEMFKKAGGNIEGHLRPEATNNDLVDDVAKRFQNIKPELPKPETAAREMINEQPLEIKQFPIPPVQLKTENAKEVGGMLKTGENITQRPQTQKPPQQQEVIIKVTMDGESTIKLEPIVKQIVNKMYGNNDGT